MENCSPTRVRNNFQLEVQTREQQTVAPGVLVNSVLQVPPGARGLLARAAEDLTGICSPCCRPSTSSSQSAPSVVLGPLMAATRDHGGRPSPLSAGRSREQWAQGLEQCHAVDQSNQSAVHTRNRKELYLSQAEGCSPEASLPGNSEEPLWRSIVFRTAVYLVGTGNIHIKQVRDTFFQSF